MADNDDSGKEEAALLKEKDALEKEAKKDLELAKYKANALDRASTAIFSVAVFTPLVGLILGLNAVIMMSPQKIIGWIAGCLVVGLILHRIGKEALEEGYR